MALICFHDRQRIEAFLRSETWLHLYEIGDLDDFFWPYTTWYGWQVDGQLRALALLYSGGALPTLLSFGSGEGEVGKRLLRAATVIFPRRFYAHLTVGWSTALTAAYELRSHGVHAKMALVEPMRLQRADAANVTALTAADLPALRRLYEQSYPGNWFEPRMLQTQQYVGIRERGRLLCVAGVHVYSAHRRVAALGNVTTHPSVRGRGLATTACAYLCRQLLRTVDDIGLNVHGDNVAAIRCYERLGFRSVARYEEWSAQSRSEGS